MVPVIPTSEIPQTLTAAQAQNQVAETGIPHLTSVIKGDKTQQEREVQMYSAIPEKYAYPDPMKLTSGPEFRGDIAGDGPTPVDVHTSNEFHCDDKGAEVTMEAFAYQMIGNKASWTNYGEGSTAVEVYATDEDVCTLNNYRNYALTSPTSVKENTELESIVQFLVQHNFIRRSKPKTLEPSAQFSVSPEKHAYPDPLKPTSGPESVSYAHLTLPTIYSV